MFSGGNVVLSANVLSSISLDLICMTASVLSIRSLVNGAVMSQDLNSWSPSIGSPLTFCGFPRVFHGKLSLSDK